MKAVVPFVAATLAVASACGGESTRGAITSATRPIPSTTSVSTTVLRSADAPDGVDEARSAALAAAWSAYGSPGAIAVVVDGGHRWALALGEADLTGTPAAVEQRFRAASITKPVIATLAFQLAEERRLDLDAPVSELVPAAVLRPDPPVTVRQLLSHTAGIFNVGDEGDIVTDLLAIEDETLRASAAAFLEAAATDVGAVVPAEVAVAAAETHDRYGEPDAVYHYSNAGYQLAGLAIEAATGATLAELVDAQITGPLALRATTLAPSDRTTPEFRGYETATADGSRVDVADDLRAFGNGANGGLLTTADDLAALFSALLGEGLVTADSLADMQRVTPASRATGALYGAGLARYELTCGTFYGHEGGVNGTASIAVADPTGDRVAVVAFNQRGIGDPHLPALADTLLCSD